jgi:hypothetical protein
MALAAQQSLLDELMGKGRNAAKGEKVHQYRFDDPRVSISAKKLLDHIYCCFNRSANLCSSTIVHMSSLLTHDKISVSGLFLVIQNPADYQNHRTL